MHDRDRDKRFDRLSLRISWGFILFVFIAVVVWDNVQYITAADVHEFLNTARDYLPVYLAGLLVGAGCLAFRQKRDSGESTKEALNAFGDAAILWFMGFTVGTVIPLFLIVIPMLVLHETGVVSTELFEIVVWGSFSFCVVVVPPIVMVEAGLD